MEKITVLGIGNILLQDEGLGVKTIERLSQDYQFPENVQVLDGGTLGMGLIAFVEGADKLIIVDAVSGKLPPGSIYELKGSEVKAYFQQAISLHDLGIQDVLATLEVLDKPINEVVVFGMQPKTIDVGLELSEVVVPGIARLESLVIEQLSAWKVEVRQVGQ
ncbi:Hydrogenase 1 maturation protease [bioreactor metagenome]|uniref:Hydrogenase 1 maturation protease n=1 Tax=bioreactor metagenome TaxID=1076179 RepID=A0A644T8S1_9ZZZZ|nr:HyaD/HybD family hydrogenase maturation endopeptidase [Negativicutes bacterium]